MKRIGIYLLIFCFYSSTLWAQSYSIQKQGSLLSGRQEPVALQDLIHILQQLVQPLENKEAFDCAIVLGVIDDLQSFNAIIYSLLRSTALDTACTIMYWLALFWLFCGTQVIISFLWDLLIRTVFPPLTIIGEIFGTLNLIRKFIDMVIIAPVAAINFVLTSIQYMDCMNSHPATGTEG